MDDALARVSQPSKMPLLCSVLILVVMDDALAQFLQLAMARKKQRS